MQNLNTKDIIINPDLNLKQQPLNQHGVAVKIYDEIFHCVILKLEKFFFISITGVFFNTKLLC